VRKLKDGHGLAKTRDNDTILADYQRLYAGKVGDPLPDADHEAARKEALRRIDSKIPPGYRDVGKDDPCGDYLLWKQTLLRAEAERPACLLLVTADTKEDWYLSLKGQTICARPELARELMDAAGARLIMMSRSTFLHHAKTHLGAQVSQDTIQQSENLSQREAEGRAAREREMEREMERAIAARHEQERARLRDERATVDARIAEWVPGVRSLERDVAGLSARKAELMNAEQPTPAQMDELREVDRVLDLTRVQLADSGKRLATLEGFRDDLLTSERYVTEAVENITRRHTNPTTSPSAGN
jgi:hypothetical protein